jgi:hypothetical protein
VHSAGSRFYQKFSAAFQFHPQAVFASYGFDQTAPNNSRFGVQWREFVAGNIVLGLPPEASFIQATKWLVSIDPGLKYHSRDKPFLLGVLLESLRTSLSHYLSGLHN